MVLSLLYGRPDQTFYLRQIIRMTGSGQGAVQRELGMLAEAGIIVRSRVGNHVFFQANSRCPVFSELRGLIMKTAGLADILREALKPLTYVIRAAFIYGSFADGRDTASSDVDVMIIGDIPFGTVLQALNPAQEKLGREINPNVYPVSEFSRKMSEDNSFIERVLTRKKIFLFGDEDEFGRLARESLGN